MPTPLTRPTDPATESSILLLRQDLYDQHAATYALLENILGASQDLQQDYMEDIYHFLEESIPNRLNDIILALSPIQNSLSFQSSIQNDMHQLLSGYVMGELQALNLSLNVIATRLQSILDAIPSEGGSVDLTTVEARLQSILDAMPSEGGSVDLTTVEARLQSILDAMPSEGGGVDLTTVEARLQSILDAIGSSGTWTLRGVLDWWRLNFEDFDGSLAPYRMLARQKNIYEALTGEGASNHGDDYLYGKVAAIYEALTGEGSGVDLSTIESRLQSIRDAIPSDAATEGTLTNTLTAVIALQPMIQDVLNALGGGAGWTVRDVLIWLRTNWESSGGPAQMMARLQSILDAMPSESSGVDLTTVEARLQSILDAIGSSGTWTLRGVLDWWRLNFEDFDGSLAPYRMLARQKNIYEALTGEGASNHGDDYLYGKVAAIYEALTGEDSGVDLSTIESRLQSIRDAMPSDAATEGTLTNTLTAVIALQPMIQDVLNALGGGAGWTVRDVLIWLRTNWEPSGGPAHIATQLQTLINAMPAEYATETTLALLDTRALNIMNDLAQVRSNQGTNTQQIITTLNSLDFCCEQGGDLTPPDPGTDPPSSDHCQRAQWAIDGAIALMQTLAMLTQVGRKTVENAYHTIFGVVPSYAHCQAVSHTANEAIQDALPENAFTSLINTMQALQGELVCAISNAADAGDADDAYQQAIENLPVSYSQALVAARIALPLDILNPLFAGTLPDSAALSGYAATFCDDCSGSTPATLPCPPSAGQPAMEVASNYRFLDAGGGGGKYHRAILWDVACRSLDGGRTPDTSQSCATTEVFVPELANNEAMILPGNFNGYTFQEIAPLADDMFVLLIGSDGDAYCRSLSVPVTVDTNTAWISFVTHTNSIPGGDTDVAFTLRVTPPGAA